MPLQNITIPPGYLIPDFEHEECFADMYDVTDGHKEHQRYLAGQYKSGPPRKA